MTQQMPDEALVGQRDKYRTFVALHARPGAFVMPNPWDAGSTRMLTALGFDALATTSSGFAFAIGRRDSARTFGYASDAMCPRARPRDSCSIRRDEPMTGRRGSTVRLPVRANPSNSSS